MWEGIIAGVITFIICELISFSLKKHKNIFKWFRTKFHQIKRWIKGKPSLKYLIKIEKMPEDKRTKRQKELYENATKKMREIIKKSVEDHNRFMNNLKK
jgi:hypothetical protein